MAWAVSTIEVSAKGRPVHVLPSLGDVLGGPVREAGVTEMDFGLAVFAGEFVAHYRVGARRPCGGSPRLRDALVGHDFEQTSSTESAIAW